MGLSTSMVVFGSVQLHDIGGWHLSTGHICFAHCDYFWNPPWVNHPITKKWQHHHSMLHRYHHSRFQNGHKQWLRFPVFWMCSCFSNVFWCLFVFYQCFSQSHSGGFILSVMPMLGNVENAMPDTIPNFTRGPVAIPYWKVKIHITSHQGLVDWPVDHIFMARKKPWGNPLVRFSQ